MKINNVYVGNNIEVLKTFPDNSIDSVVTDPPYGLGKEPNAIEVLQSWITTGYHEVKGKGFMGKEWDAFVPQPNFWKEIYRVLKPGGYVLSFAGTRTYDWMVMAIRLAGFEIRDQIAWVYGSGFPKSYNIGKAMPTDELQAKWQGWGTALKPALEPIVMARKPLSENTIADNVIKHGVGGINIDEARVDTGETIAVNVGFKKNKQSDGWGLKRTITENKVIGRFPANFIHDGSDEVLKLFPNTQSSAGSFKASDYKQGDGVTNFTRGDFEGYGDEGSAARFFYVPKASVSERNFGLENFTKQQKVFNGQSSTPSEDMKGVEKKFSTQPMANIHPTVKPVELMKYLVKMVTPKDGVCLDPFIGSGTTGIACKEEKIDYIGIELNEEYAEIAKARIEAAIVQYDIFDFLEEE